MASIEEQVAAIEAKLDQLIIQFDENFALLDRRLRNGEEELSEKLNRHEEETDRRFQSAESPYQELGDLIAEIASANQEISESSAFVGGYRPTQETWLIASSNFAEF